MLGPELRNAREYVEEETGQSRHVVCVLICLCGSNTTTPFVDECLSAELNMSAYVSESSVRPQSRFPGGDCGKPGARSLFPPKEMLLKQREAYQCSACYSETILIYGFGRGGESDNSESDHEDSSGRPTLRAGFGSHDSRGELRTP